MLPARLVPVITMSATSARRARSITSGRSGSNCLLPKLAPMSTSSMGAAYPPDSRPTASNRSCYPAATMPTPRPTSISLSEKFEQVKALWTPHRIAQFDGHQLLLARIEGEFVWHDHSDHDEVFLPISGTLLMDLEDQTSGAVREVRVEPGQVLVVPAGVRHCPRTLDGEEVTMLVIDPMGVKHTGDVRDPKTVDEYPKI